MSTSWRFEIEAMVDAQSLPRVIGYFAQRSITLKTLAMHVTDETMHIEILIFNLSADHAQIIAAKLGELFAVFAVRIELSHSSSLDG